MLKPLFLVLLSTPTQPAKLEEGLKAKKRKKDMRVINDPLAQTHSSANSDHYSRLNFVLFGEILKSGNEQTTSAQILITTGRDCWSASWIKK